MEHYDLTVIRKMMFTAGERATAHFCKVKPFWKDNKTYITEADLEVQSFLKQELEREFPDDGLIGEEQHLSKPPLASERYWVIDPIDGTASFVRGFPVWGIAIGLLTPQQVLGGFFYVPTTNDFYYTLPDGTVWRNDQLMSLHPPDPESREAVLLTGARIHQNYTFSTRYRGKIRSLGSTIAHLCYVATGSADAAFVEDVAVWDLAAGMAMVLLNHGVAEYLDGSPVSLDDLLSSHKAGGEILLGHPEAVARYRQWIAFRTS